MSRSVTITVSEVSDAQFSAVLVALGISRVTQPTSLTPAPVTSARDIAVGDFAALAAYTVAMDLEDVLTWESYAGTSVGQPRRWRQLVYKQLRRSDKHDESEEWG